MSSLISYAQNFEDVMLWRALKDVEIGFYIDIGAQDPVIDSVSLAFYEKGWRGIHVEATPYYANLLRKDRPEDTVIQAAVGTAKGFVQFFEIPETGISTGDAAIAAEHVERGFKVHNITVPSISLASVFSLCKNREIHWLKIDVEGFESQVLLSWGKSTARPYIVVVESTLPLTQIESHAKWESYLIKLGYSYVYFDGLNRFYVSEKNPELKRAFRSGPNVFDGFVFNGTGSAPFWSLIEQRHQIKLDEKTRDFDARSEQLRSQIKTLEQSRSSRELELEAKQSETLSQLQQRNLERNEALIKSEQLTALLQSRESELHQAASTSAHVENQLRTSLLKVSEASRAELATITQQLGQNVARFSNDLNTQIERNVLLNTDLNTERIRVSAANEALNAARTEASCSKDLHIQKEETFDRNLAAEKARNEVLEKQLHSEKAKNARNELELAAYCETTLRQAETIGQKDKVFVTELNSYREGVKALERELSDAKSEREKQVVIHQAFVNNAEQTLQNLNIRVRELDTIISQQANHITSIEQQNLLDSQHYKRAISTAENKIAELTHQRQLYLIRSMEKKSVSSQLELRLAALSAELQHIRATNTWRFTYPFRWVKSVLFDNPKPSSRNIASAPIALQLLPASIDAVPNELTMPLIDSQMKILDPETSGGIVPDLFNSNELFISRTYKSLLGREPEPTGAALYLDQLNNNVPREIIFREIQMSEEGKAYTLAMELDQTIASNMHVEDLDVYALLAKHDKVFVVAAYQHLLKRAPDVAGYSSYLTRLRSGVSKLQLLTEMRHSVEGKLHTRSPSGLDDLMRRGAREKIFFFGNIFKALSNISRTSSIENTLERVESQIFVASEDNRERASHLAAETRLAHLETRALIDKKMEILTNEISSRLNDIDSATRALFDKKMEALADEMRARSVEIASKVNERLNRVDLVLARQNIGLQRKGLEERRELLASTIRKDATVSAVYDDLEQALTLEKKRTQ